VKFEATRRDCTARIGKLDIGKDEILTPGILWYSSDRIKAPSFASFFLSGGGGGVGKGDSNYISSSGSFFHPRDAEGEAVIPPSFVMPYAFPSEMHSESADWNEKHASSIQVISGRALDKISGDATIYVLSNARELFSNPRNFARAVTAVREAIGYQKVLYAPGLGEPSHLAMLSYMTVDMFDSISLVENARRGVFLFAEGKVDSGSMDEMQCSCPSCLEGDRSFSGILSHNYHAAFSEIRRVRNAIRNGELRNLVETRASSQPEIASMLRILDGEYYEFQERRYPSVGGRVVASPLSLDRPDIERFRRRVVGRYARPDSAKILVLLPCSARKPYSFSRSHRIFRRAIESCGNPEVVHRVVVTSPLGIVPIELEMAYPAAHYDISVTGEWSHEEQEMVRSQLDAYLKKNRYDIVIDHLPDEISSFIDVDGTRTCDGHPTSPSSMDGLSSVLGKESAGYERISPNKRKFEDVKSLVSYQFGDSSIIDGCTVRGKYPNYKIFCDGRQIGMVVGSRGLVSLTLEGGRRLAETGSYRVEIDDFIPRGSIFAVGVTDADKNIRCGDEVVVLHDGDVRAVGVAAMGGEEMVASKSGEAVKVRHHKK